MFVGVGEGGGWCLLQASAALLLAPSITLATRCVRARAQVILIKRKSWRLLRTSVIPRVELLLSECYRSMKETRGGTALGGTGCSSFSPPVLRGCCRGVTLCVPLLLVHRVGKHRLHHSHRVPTLAPSGGSIMMDTPHELSANPVSKVWH